MAEPPTATAGRTGVQNDRAHPTAAPSSARHPTARQRAELMAEVRRLRLAARRRVDDLFAGEYHAAFKGQGIEFSEVREYEPGDDVRSIDWNVTARAGKPFIKRFQEERQLTVFCCVDTSASGVFGSGGRTKSLALAEACGMISLAAQMNRDRAGLMLFSDDVDLVLPPGKTATHHLRLLRELLGAAPSGRGAGMIEALRALGTALRRRAIVFVASDFLLPERVRASDELAGALRQLRRRHEVIALRVADPAELDPPKIGLVEIEDPESGDRRLVDFGSRGVRRRMARVMAEERAGVEKLLRRCRVDLVDLSTREPVGDALARYFRMRERRRAHG